MIMFKDTGGIEEILDGINGKVVGHLDTHEMASEAIKLSKDGCVQLPCCWDGVLAVEGEGGGR